MNALSIYENEIATIKWPENETEKYYALLIQGKISGSSLDLFTNEHMAFGQFSLIKQVDDSTYEAIRDPLGIEKLFYTEASSHEIFFSSHFTDLIPYQSKIFSVPKGAHVQIGPSGERKLIKRLGIVDPYIKNTTDSANVTSTLEEFQTNVTLRLSEVFSLIRSLEEQDWKVFVALSGGLDSTIIANLAKQYLVKPIACTVDLGNSEDAEKSSLIAQSIGLEHLVFETDENEIRSELDNAPLLCQDFRDFNVHCTVLNAILGRNIRHWATKKALGDRLIVLTGDLMNEYTCDYSEEVIDNVRYYRLPRIPVKKLQENLIGGLDTSDREVSPFRKYGLWCIQPYAVLYDLYLSLNEEVLSLPDAKKHLNSFLVDEELLEYIPKSKLRAQVGSKDNMGVLGLCHRLGIDDKYFVKQLLMSSGGDLRNIPIHMGRYEVEKFVHQK